MRKLLAGLLAALFFLTAASSAPAQGNGPLLGVWKTPSGGTGPSPSSVFDIDLWTGTNLSNAITTPFAPDMVWVKSRANATDHALFDTTRGVGRYLRSNTNNLQGNDTTTLSAFNVNGYSLGTDTAALVNTITRTYVGWAFAKTAKFFDVETWTGNATNRTIVHNLGVAPGLILVKQVNSVARDWAVYHKSLPNTSYLVLDSTAAAATDATMWNSTSATSTVFSVGTNNLTNGSVGDTYVAYLFADDPSGIIQEGTFTTDGSGNATVTLGGQPQFLLYKRSDSTGDWFVLDATRGWVSGTGDKRLYPNLSAAEDTGNYGDPSGTGFTVVASASATYVYMAIKAP